MTPSPILAFDIETIPDTVGLRRLHDVPAELEDSELVDIVQRRLRQEKNNDFFPHHLQRVATISCVLRQFNPQAAATENFKIFSLPHRDQHSEAEAIFTFFRLIDKYQPRLVSWNGGGFDLPVLHYRALVHRQQAATYWRNDGDFKWNTYTARFHERHIDLMDVLSMYQPRAFASLNDFALLCGLPGKIGIGGDRVWQAWQEGEIDAIRTYCENDALLTYLLYLRYEHFRGNLDETAECEFVRQQLQGERWQEFVEGWRIEAKNSVL
ncbi:MAG: 3'-5' exonuclease [Proteobacteria bacterium]|nr:3'-5' exonuclease [Pseudomonadota bacterium]